MNPYTGLGKVSGRARPAQCGEQTASPFSPYSLALCYHPGALPTIAPFPASSPPRPEKAAELFSKGRLGFVLEGTEDYYIKGSSEVRLETEKTLPQVALSPHAPEACRAVKHQLLAVALQESTQCPYGIYGLGMREKLN